MQAATIFVVTACLAAGFWMIHLVLSGFKETVSPEFLRIEHKLNRILAHLGLDVEEPFDDAVFQLALSGKKIEAIKKYRKQTGASLAVAKSEVERMLREIPAPKQAVADRDF